MLSPGRTKTQGFVPQDYVTERLAMATVISAGRDRTDTSIIPPLADHLIGAVHDVVVAQKSTVLSDGRGL